MIELRIPAIGDAVSDMYLVEWVVEDGAKVNPGDILYTIESDKSVVEIVSPGVGSFKKLENDGKFFPVGHLIGMLV